MKKRMVYGMIFSLALGFVAIQSHAASNSSAPAKGAVQTDQTSNPGAAFLEANKNKSGVVTLPSGLQYEVIEQGKGKKPSLKDTVTVDYEGKLIDGTIFDSSYQRGEPASFPVSQVIAGWQEAIPMMNVGSTWMLYIPSSLAYGKEGAGGVIGPDQTLVFKVHLISIK